MIFIGADPGVSGALAFLYENMPPRVEDMPTRPTRTALGLIKREVFAEGVQDLLRNFTAPGAAKHICIESVGIMGGVNNAIQIQGSLVRSFTIVEACAELDRYEISYVQPQAWKKFYGLGRDKGEALRIACELFPQLADHRLTRAKDHNRAEALLIANFAKRIQE